MAETKRIPAAIAGIAADPPYLARLASRFWRKVAKSETGCWEWLAGKFEEGYGAFSIRGVGNVRAPRVAFWLTTGQWPEAFFVCHRCDNPGCVRPDHLFLGTHTDNMRDSREKGRRPKGYRTHCKWGHAFSSENTLVGRHGWRFCLVCMRTKGRAYQNEWVARNRERINANRRARRRNIAAENGSHD